MKTIAIVSLVFVIMLSGCAPTSQSPEAAMITAAAMGNLQVVQTCLADGVGVNAKKTDHGTTALMAAALNGRTEVVELLLEKVLYVNARDNTGARSLSMAAFKGNIEVVKLILEKERRCHNLRRHNRPDCSGDEWPHEGRKASSGKGR